MKAKTVVGALLLVLSIAGLLVWENWGRDALTLTAIAVPAEDIKAGQIIQLSDLGILRIRTDSLIEGALSPVQASALAGKAAAYDLKAKQQLTESYFIEPASALSDGKSLFMLPDEWLYSRPGSLRSGDDISLYMVSDKSCLGCYSIAYLRDSDQQAVFDAGTKPGNLLSRDATTGIVSCLEIICTPEEYFMIFDAVQAAGPGCLVAVPEA